MGSSHCAGAWEASALLTFKVACLPPHALPLEEFTYQNLGRTPGSTRLSGMEHSLVQEIINCGRET